MAITCRWHWDDHYLYKMTLRWLLPPDGDIEMTTANRGWHWDDNYHQRVTLRWLLPAKGNIEMTTTCSEWHWYDYRALPGVGQHILSSSVYSTIVTRRVPLVEQDLLNLPENLIPPPVSNRVCVARSSVFCKMLCRWLSFVILVIIWSVRLGFIYGFWFPLVSSSFFFLNIIFNHYISSIYISGKSAMTAN